MSEKEGRIGGISMKKVWRTAWQFVRYAFWPQHRSKEIIISVPTERLNHETTVKEITPPLPPKEGEVRLYSAFSQGMYCDVPLNKFCEVAVDCNGVENSNHFLLSLWNEMNHLLHPQDSNYVPWHYRPDIIENNPKWKLLMLGDVHTSSGNFHILLRMKDRSSIRGVMAFNSDMSKKDCQSLFEKLVSNAKKNVSRLHSYSCSVWLKCLNCDVKSSGIYGGKNFYLHSNAKGVCVYFRVRAIDYIEAKQQIARRLDELCAFLSVETNLLFVTDREWEIKENDKTLPITVNPVYMKPFIDGPSIRQESLLLSEAGAQYLDHYIFVDRDIDDEEVTMYFKRSCTHVYEGLQKQIEKGDRVGYTTRTQAFILTQKENLRSQNIITMAAMSYLSALETASTPEGKPEICPTCGNLNYRISSRVESIVSRYLNPESGRVFKELYNLRSKYLHAGKLSCENYYITARPFIDTSTGSGLTDYGVISCRVQGKLMVIGIQNIQELTTYVLRCYYQDKLFGIKDFDLEDDHSSDIDLKQILKDKLQEVMPEGIVVEDVTTM